MIIRILASEMSDEGTDTRDALRASLRYSHTYPPFLAVLKDG